MKPKRKKDWEGRYVRLLHEMQTKVGAIFEAGEVMRVTRNYGGLFLEAVIRCEHCARRTNFQINKVPEYQVELLREDYSPHGPGRCDQCDEDAIYSYGGKKRCSSHYDGPQ